MKIGRCVTDGFAPTISAGLGQIKLATSNFASTNTIKRFYNNRQVCDFSSLSTASLTMTGGSAFVLNFAVFGNFAGTLSAFGPGGTVLAFESAIQTYRSEVFLPFFDGGSEKNTKLNDRYDLLLATDTPFHIAKSTHNFIFTPSTYPYGNKIMIDFSFLHFGFWIADLKIDYKSIVWSPKERRITLRLQNIPSTSSLNTLLFLLHGQKTLPFLFYDQYQILENTFNFQLVMIDGFSFSISPGDLYSGEITGVAI